MRTTLPRRPPQARASVSARAIPRTRWARGRPRPSRLASRLVLHVRRAGDVEMRPRWTIDELLQKDRGRDRAAPASARVLHVRPLAADQALVLVPLGQSP